MKKEKERKELKEKLLKEKEEEKKHFEELIAREKERIKNKKIQENQENNESIGNNNKNNLKLNNNLLLRKGNNSNFRNKIYNDSQGNNSINTTKKGNKTSISNNNSFNFDKNKNPNKNSSNIFRKNITELNNNYNKNDYNTLSSNKKNENIDKETEIDDNNSHRLGISMGKHEKFMKIKFGDPLNPYMTNWPSSFLKIGYNVGFHYNQLQKGVPLLRIQKLKKNIVFPPLYTIQYNKFTENKNYIGNETEKLACNSVVKKLFTPMSTRYGFNDLKKNKSKKNFETFYNKLFIPKYIKDEAKIKLIDTNSYSDRNLLKLSTNKINNENKEDTKDSNKEMLIIDNNIKKEEKK